MTVSGDEFAATHYDSEEDQARQRGACMSDDYSVLKIAGGVLLALVLWNAFERYQQRKAIEEGIKELQRIAADPDPLGWRAAAAQRQQAAQRQRPSSSVTTSALKPVPPGFRCESGTLLKRIEGGWTQVTSRNNEVYCPHGGTVEDCYRVSAESTGCR